MISKPYRNRVVTAKQISCIHMLIWGFIGDEKKKITAGESSRVIDEGSVSKGLDRFLPVNLLPLDQ